MRSDIGEVCISSHGYYNINNDNIDDGDDGKNNNNSTIMINTTTNNSTENSYENVCMDMFHYSSRRSEIIPEHLRMDITFVVRNLFGYHPKNVIKVKATNTTTNHKQLLYDDGNYNDSKCR